jgi:hypothetical protein
MAQALRWSIDDAFTIFSDCGGEVEGSFDDSTRTRRSIGLGRQTLEAIPVLESTQMNIP